MPQPNNRLNRGQVLAHRPSVLGFIGASHCVDHRIFPPFLQVDLEARARMDLEARLETVEKVASISILFSSFSSFSSI